MKRSQLYDSIYSKTDRLFKKYNPCNICNKDGKLTCANDRYNTDKPHQLCCTRYDDKCKYYSNKGCTTKCLSCKLYICPNMYYELQQKNVKIKEFCSKLRILHDLACKYQFSTNRYFHSKKESLQKDMIYQESNW